MKNTKYLDFSDSKLCNCDDNCFSSHHKSTDLNIDCEDNCSLINHKISDSNIDCKYDCSLIIHTI